MAACSTCRAFPEDQLEFVLLIECPRFLFPFARRIISDMTAEGGYPPFHLEPIDFAAVYAAQRAQSGQPTTRQRLISLSPCGRGKGPSEARKGEGSCCRRPHPAAAAEVRPLTLPRRFAAPGPSLSHKRIGL